MNLQSLVVVALRLIALDFVVRQLVQLIPYLLYLFGEETSDAFGSLPWLLIVGLLGVAAFLWFLAVPIARLVIRGVPQEFSFGSVSLADCYSLAFIAVGLFYVAGHVPQVLNLIHWSIQNAATPGMEIQLNRYDSARAVMTLVIGLVLLANGRRWAVMLARKHSTPAARSPGQPE